jgi:hypothetical protein
MVSPKPLSDFVPDVALILFPILVPNSRRACRAVAEHFPRAKRPSFRVKKMILILMLRANSSLSPNPSGSMLFPAAF